MAAQIADLLRSAAALLRPLPDAERAAALASGALDELIQAIAQPRPHAEVRAEHPYDYLLRRRHSLGLLARLRQVITVNYSVEGVVDGRTVFVSPFYAQWFDDAVLFVQGEQRFEGWLGRYRDGVMQLAVAARDGKKGEPLGPEDFLFVDPQVVLDRERTVMPSSMMVLDTALAELRALIERGEERESAYQALLTKYPWVFGAQYKSVEAHTALDDRNIPDYTASRVRDSARDIIEIKPPFLRLFRSDGEFSADFNNAWNQVERYLDFVRREADYLYRQRRLRFDAPHCVLIVGKDLSDEEIDRLRAKQRMNPAISVYTYDDLLALAEHTVAFVKRLRSDVGAQRPNEALQPTGRGEHPG